MKKNLFIIFLFFIIGGYTHVYSQITYNTFADSLQGDFKGWVEQRVENAKNGIKEKIEMPLVVRTLAWGCRCPDNYIGVGVNTQEGPWIFPITKKPLPKPDQKGYSLIVTGYFTGEMKNIDLRQNSEEPDEWNYTIPVFQITGWVKNTKGYDTPAPTVKGK